MDNTLKKVVAMLHHEGEDVQCAAAKVLSELDHRDKDVVQALGQCLSASKLSVRCAVLEALGKSGRSDSLRYILPYLTSPQLGERNRAVSATVALGPEVLPAVLKDLTDDEPVNKSTLLTILQRFPLTDSLKHLLEILPRADREAVDSICEDFHRKQADIEDETVRTEMAESIRSSASKATFKRSEVALAGALRMLGGLRDEGALSLYMKLLQTEDTAPRVTRQALLCLAKIHVPPKDHAKLWPVLSKFLLTEDNPGLVQAANDLTSRINLPASATKDLVKLLEHRDPNVQLNAVKKLGIIASSDAGEALASMLGAGDWKLREQVMKSLQQCPNAGEVLLAQLHDIEDDTLFGQAAHKVQEAKPKLTKAQFAKHLSQAIKTREVNSKRGDNILSLLSSLDLDAFSKAILDKGKELIEAGNYEEAESDLRFLSSGRNQNNDAKFLLALARFKTSNRGLLKAERDNNKSLALFTQMIEFDGMDVASMLTKEKTLIDLADLYYIGFHFAEQMGKLRQFGIDLLQYVVKSGPKSKEAKEAKNKLKLSGVE
jgi:HEAT repeat protein